MTTRYPVSICGTNAICLFFLKFSIVIIFRKRISIIPEKQAKIMISITIPTPAIPPIAPNNIVRFANTNPSAIPYTPFNPMSKHNSTNNIIIPISNSERSLTYTSKIDTAGIKPAKCFILVTSQFFESSKAVMIRYIVITNKQLINMILFILYPIIPNPRPEFLNDASACPYR